jgi:hypothetical protein
MVACGFLRCSNGDGDELRPLLWFSKHQFWEPTATKFIRKNGMVRPMTFEEQRDGHGCIRFGLPANDKRLLPWARACKYAGINSKLRLQMEKTGRRLGANPSHWFAVTEPINLPEMTFEVLDGDRWIDADPAATQQAGGHTATYKEWRGQAPVDERSPIAGPRFF